MSEAKPFRKMRKRHSESMVDLLKELATDGSMKDGV